jgi:hypothetical protein
VTPAIKDRRITGKNIETGKPRHLGLNKKYAYRVIFPSGIKDHGKLFGTLVHECAADSKDMAKSSVLRKQKLGYIINEPELYSLITVRDITNETSELLAAYFSYGKTGERQLPLKDENFYREEYRILCGLDEYLTTGGNLEGILFGNPEECEECLRKLEDFSKKTGEELIAIKKATKYRLFKKTGSTEPYFHAMQSYN